MLKSALWLVGIVAAVLMTLIVYGVYSSSVSRFNYFSCDGDYYATDLQDGEWANLVWHDKSGNIISCPTGPLGDGGICSAFYNCDADPAKNYSTFDGRKFVHELTRVVWNLLHLRTHDDWTVRHSPN
ncbi:MAG: hypothetical protein WC030_02950 [Candidatus Paceibacterota bacterium]